MPVQSCQVGDKPGFRWGTKGRCYAYAPGNKASREAARQKALTQGRAQHASKTGTVQNFCLTASLQHLSDSAMKKIVDREAIERIKWSDPEPEIKVFSVGHEGEATGGLVGKGKVFIKYFRDAITKIVEKIRIGTAVFNRHGRNNDHEGRTYIGEVVGKTTKVIDGVLHALAAVYINKEHSKTPFDIASIESNITYTTATDDPEDELIRLKSIDDITGIALSSSQVDTPGFPGATLLGAFQAFREKITHMGDEKMTLEEIQALIKEGAFSPSDLFSKEVLVADTVVAKHVHDSKQTEYEHARRVEESLGEARKARETEVKELKGQIETLTAQGIQGQARPALDTLIGDRKLTDVQKGYVEKHFDSFNSKAKDEAGLKTDLVAWTDKQLSDLDDVSKLLNVNQEKKPGENEEENRSQQSASPDESNPDKNPFIPGGKAAEAAGN